MSSAITLCVQLWAHPQREADLIDYEDRVLVLLPQHGGRLVKRVRRIGLSAEAFETHIIDFPNEVALEAYMADPTRLALTELRDSAIAETLVSRVDVIV